MVMELVIPDSETVAADYQEAERKIKLAEIDEAPAAVEAAEILVGEDEPATDEEIKQAAQFSPGSVSPAAEIVDKHNQIRQKMRQIYLRDKADMEERLAGLTIEEMKLKEQAKLCKKNREALAEELSNLIDAWEFETVQAGAGAGGCADGSSDQPDVTPPAEPASVPAEAVTDESQARYQQVLDAANVSVLGLPVKLSEKLQESGATTIWKLEQLRAEIAQGRKEWPKGIGETKVTQIEDAILKWMSQHSETWDEPPPEPPAQDSAESLIDDL